MILVEVTVKSTNRTAIIFMLYDVGRGGDWRPLRDAVNKISFQRLLKFIVF
jgi:hypothetical protein